MFYKPPMVEAIPSLTKGLAIIRKSNRINKILLQNYKNVTFGNTQVFLNIDKRIILYYFCQSGVEKVLFTDVVKDHDDFYIRLSKWNTSNVSLDSLIDLDGSQPLEKLNNYLKEFNLDFETLHSTYLDCSRLIMNDI